MQISANDVAKLNGALKNYRHARKEERNRIKKLKREEQTRIERERLEEQRQIEMARIERERQMNDTKRFLAETAMPFAVTFAVIAGIIAVIYFCWDFIQNSLAVITSIVVVGFLAIILLSLMGPTGIIIVVAYVILKFITGCDG